MVRKVLVNNIIFCPVITIFNNCNKSDTGGGTAQNALPAPPTPVIPVLKEASSVSMGAGFTDNLFKNNETYPATSIKTQFDGVTAEYEMKRRPNGKNNRAYTKMYDLINLVQSAGLAMHNHALAWHHSNWFDNGDNKKPGGYRFAGGVKIICKLFLYAIIIGGMTLHPSHF